MWWNGINPEWREREDGRPIIGGSGDWAMMIKGGINGFLMVLSSLVGLKDVADIDDWRVALRDVEWVLQHVAVSVTGTR